jgi:hypothetical protein
MGHRRLPFVAALLAALIVPFACAATSDAHRVAHKRGHHKRHHHRRRPKRRHHRRAAAPRQPAPAQAAESPPPPSGLNAAIPPGATWFSTFEDPNPWSKWEGYAQPLQVLQGGAKPDQIQAIESVTAAIPPPPGYLGTTKVLLTQVDDAQYHQWHDNYPHSYCCVEAKVYHEWGGPDPGRSPAMQPGGESGSYRAWYYLPVTTPTSPANDVRWVNLMEWKSASVANPGDQSVDGGAALLPVNGKVWICFGRGWPDCYPPSAKNAVPAPLGQWFELRADFYHGSHVDWFIDGRKVWTSTNIASLQPGQNWIFGIGHYGGVGAYYAKNASFTPFAGIRLP